MLDKGDDSAGRIESCMISIVIPSYNYAHFLPDAVKSVVAQEGSWELIIIDDGSTDNTQDVISTLQQEFPNKFSVICQENRGLAATRNRGWSEAKGRYLLFLDADDYLCKGAVQRVQKFLIDNGTPAMLICDYFSCSGTQKKLRKNSGLPDSPEKRIHAYLFNKTVSIAPSATLIRRDVFESLSFPETLAGSEDLPFFSGVLANFSDVCCFYEPLTYMRRHENSMRRDFKRMEEAGGKLNEEILKCLPCSFQSWERRLEGRRLLSLSRLSLLAGDKEKSKRYYWQGVRVYPASLFRWSYLRKQLKIIFM